MGAPEESQTVYDSTTSRAGPDIETLKTILLGLLCAVLLFILIFLVMNTWPTLVSYYRKVVPEDKKHVEKRTQTIRSWTISKVRTYPSVWANKKPMYTHLSLNRTHVYVYIARYWSRETVSALQCNKDAREHSCGIPFRWILLRFPWHLQHFFSVVFLTGIYETSVLWNMFWAIPREWVGILGIDKRLPSCLSSIVYWKVVATSRRLSHLSSQVLTGGLYPTKDS